MKKGQTKIINVSCALILDDNGYLFVAQRSEKMSLPLKWEFPGGKIEASETPEECLTREIKEELGIEIKILKNLPSNIHNYPNITVELMPFVCQHVGGILTLKEHSNYLWLRPNELLNLDWAEADIPILNYYLNHRHGI